MKKYLAILMLFVALVFQSCNDILDQRPLDAYDDAKVWSNIDLAKLYLNYCYNGIGHGFNGNKFSNFTDESPHGRANGSTYITNGTMAPDVRNLYTSGSHYPDMYRWNKFSYIQKLNIFLDNIDNMASHYSESEQESIQKQADILKGEALFLRAFFYSNIARSYGGLPLMEHANTLDDDFSTVVRSSWKETVDFIVRDCDTAVELLPFKADQELGRACKEAAMAVKSRILLFAASDLTAGDVSGLEQVGRPYTDELVHYQNPDRTALWTAAKNAAKAIMDLGTLDYADYGASSGATIDEVADNYRDFFAETTPAGSEWIFTKMFDAAIGARHRTNQIDGPNGYSNNYGRNGPWELFVQKYQMADGSDFLDHFHTFERNDTTFLVHNDDYNIENPYINREARFYANVLYDSAVYDYEDRAVGGYNGIFDRRLKITISANGDTTKVYGLDTRETMYSNYSNNGCAVGYLTAKYYQDGVVGSTSYNTNQWPYLRYTEVVLNYAEACIELGTAEDLAAAKEVINKIRTRVLLPETTAETQDELRQALRHERAIELYCEDMRLFDLRRWLAIHEYMPGPTPGMGISEITDNRYTPAKITMQRYYTFVQKEFVMKDNVYWMPIYLEEIKKAPQLKQNPGYEEEEFNS